jgi:hypothetical protein
MGTIRVRYKQGEVPGDASAFNAYGVDNGFPRVVYPGTEEDIPDELLDDKEDYKMYRYPNKTEKMLTEKQYRAEQHKYGGYDRNPHYAEPAPLASRNKSILLPPRAMTPPEHMEFLKKQRDALLKYRHFNPVCMELISDEPGRATTKEDEKAVATAGKADISKMSQKDGIEYIKSIKDEVELGELSIVLDRDKNTNPIYFAVLEQQLRTLRAQ